MNAIKAIIIGGISWYFMDIGSDNLLTGLLCPIALAASVFVLLYPILTYEIKPASGKEQQQGSANSRNWGNSDEADADADGDFDIDF